MSYTISGYSTALFSTWYFIEELGILFDTGDGVSAGLLQKARKITNVFISHADRDHLTGLLQLNQLNARDGFPIIHYPANSGSFPAMETFSKKFDPPVNGTIWKAIQANDEIKIKDDLFVQSLRNDHVEAAPEIIKSLSYKIFQTKTKLRPGIASLPQDRIKELITNEGKEKLTMEVRTNVLSYSGDTPVDDYEKWDHSKILIHEATFLDAPGAGKVNTHGNKHINLEEVIKMVSEINIETLILGHFSSRYSAEQIDENIRSLCEKYLIKIPVFRILPGLIHKDILKEVPINT
ncbi:MAG: MBL fold metallo-hydrolase [Ferruginibacter sp.]